MPFNIDDLMRRYDEQQKAANSANENRYGQILQTLKGQGEASKADVRRGGADERGQIGQDLIGRGLFNTTVLDSLRGGSREREQRELSRIDESVADRTAGVMERRTDQGPNMGMFADLLRSIGQGQGAQAGYGQGQGSVGRSYSFGGVNPSRFSSGGGGGGGGGGSGNWLESFGGTGGSSTPAQGVQTITGGGWARPGTAEFGRYGTAQAVQASQFWRDQAGRPQPHATAGSTMITPAGFTYGSPTQPSQGAGAGGGGQSNPFLMLLQQLFGG